MRYVVCTALFLIIVLIGIVGFAIYRATQRFHFTEEARAISQDIYQAYQEQKEASQTKSISESDLKKHIKTAETGLVIEDEQGNIIGPWDNPLEIDILVAEDNIYVYVKSAGPDGRKGTDDDVYMMTENGRRIYGKKKNRIKKETASQ